MDLIIPESVFAQMQGIVKAKPGMETGVCLFGVYVSTAPAEGPFEQGIHPLPAYPVVLAISGPGPRATHVTVHYAADNDYANAIYEALASAMPAIEWLGEFHVHPLGMPRLSDGDLETIREVFHGAPPDTVRPERLVAGVIQRRKEGMELYPFIFARTCLAGAPMGIQRVPDDHKILRRGRAQACEDQPASPRARDGANSAEPGPAREQDNGRSLVRRLIRKPKTLKRRNER